MKSWLQKLDRLSLIKQVLIPICFSLLSCFIIFTLFAYYSSKNALLEKTGNSLQREARLIVENLQFYEENLRMSAERLSKTFFAMLEGELVINEFDTIQIADYASPSLYINDRLINADHSYPDNFTNLTSGTATIFVRYEDDFLRISTSLRKTDGSRAYGTLLGKSHPGYQTLIKGEKYIGRASLFGKEYMTVYSPIVDNNGKTIAIYYVGFDFTESLQALYQTLADIRIGENGGISLINMAQGDAFATPIYSLNALTTDEAGSKQSHYENMINQKQGIYRYHWQQTDMEKPQAMLAAYAAFEPWNMLVVSEGYVSELTQESVVLGRLLILSGVICSILIMLFVQFALRSRLKPISGISQALTRISQGDLSVDMDRACCNNSKNELHRLNLDLQSLLDNLNDLMKKIHHSTDLVNDATKNLSHVADDSVNGIEKQERGADSLATAITEMVASSQEIASFTQTAVNESQQVDDLIKQGEMTVSQAVNASNNMVNTISETAKMMEQVANDANKITSVLDVINDIAEQTNLLALNAAIEAARAGEQGRGFAVVADEVRTLAQRSQSSTHEIQNIIDDLQASSSNAMKRMDYGVECSNETVNEVNQAAVALESISQTMEKLTRMTTEIANTTENQRLVGEDINRDIITISDIARETKSHSDLLYQSIQEMQKMSGSLTSEVNKFTTR